MQKILFILKVTVIVLCICSCSSSKVITGEIKDVSDRVVECKENRFLLLKSAPMPSKGQIVTFTPTVGANFMRRIEKDDPKHYQRIVKDKTAEIIKEFKNEGNLGKLIPFNMLPPDVQQFAKQSFQ